MSGEGQAGGTLRRPRRSERERERERETEYARARVCVCVSCMRRLVYNDIGGWGGTESCDQCKHI